jgi:hypothetical protein
MVDKGFWSCEGPGQRVDVPKRIALIHSELSEALEADRCDKKDEHLPGESGLTVELADAIIRIMDLSTGLGLHVERAVIEKMKFNITRPHMHGDKRF